MLLINHPPLGPKSPNYLKTLAALQAVSDSPSAFFTTGAPGDAEREELILGTQLFDLPVARRAYLYLLRSLLGRRVPEVMTPEQLGKQLLLSAQLFAEARNAFSKAAKTQEELIAFFLVVRCASRSQVVLPDYLEEMTTNYAKAVAARAETLSHQLLNQHDLPGFLAMTTIAFSGYEDNTVPLSMAELKRYGGLTVRSLTRLHEYLTAQKGRLSATDVAMVQRSMALLASAHPADELPAWLLEVVERSPARAVTAFLQEAAAMDKKRKIAGSAWWWMHVAEVHDSGAEFESWQKPFINVAKAEAAKRLGELAIKERDAQKDFMTYSHLSCCTHKLVLELVDVPANWLEGFRVDEMRNLMMGLMRFPSQSEKSILNIGIGIAGLLWVCVAKNKKEEMAIKNIIRQTLSQLAEDQAGQIIEI